MRVSDIDIDVINTAHIWDKEKRDFSLAVVVKTWGTSPRQVGSMMLIRDDGHIVGSVSGGCVEGSVIFSAKNILTPKKLLGAIHVLHQGIHSTKK